MTGAIAVALISDIKVAAAGGIAGAPRVARHLWRMCLAFTMAAGSFFTNALPRALPVVHKLPLLVLFVPQFFLLGLLLFWMVRVRLTGWYGRNEAGVA
jgi:hypothetical protein